MRTLLSMAVIAVCTTMLLAACATASSPDAQVNDAEDHTQAEITAATVPSGATIDDSHYLCNTTEVSAAAFADQQPLESLSDVRRAMLETAAADNGLAGVVAPDTEWFVTENTPGMLTILRPLSQDESDAENGNVPQQYAKLGIAAADGATAIEDAWMPVTFGNCALTVSIPGLGVPNVGLDPAADLSHSGHELRLLAVEKDCASGQTAEDRLEVVRLTETAERVTFVLGIAPAGGTCISNPPTPVTLTLRAPLGDREIVDAGQAGGAVLRAAQ